MDGTILIADDDRTIRTVLSQAFTRAGCKVHATATLDTLMRWVEEGRGDLIVTDVMMPDGNGLDMIGRISTARPGLPVIVISAQNTMTTAVRAEAARAADYLPKPFDLPDLLRRAGAALKARPALAGTAPPAPDDALPLIGSSPAMREVFRQVAALLDAAEPVLICGETGTGKTMLAHAIHAHSARRSAPLVLVDPDDLNRPDRAQALIADADGGTVIVDGLGDVSAEGQGRLVRLMDRAGQGVRFILTVKTDFGSRDFNDLRDDLRSRVAQSVLWLPPLRERDGDIQLLVQFFADRCHDLNFTGEPFSRQRLVELEGRRWTGNVRELKGVVRALLTRSVPPDVALTSPSSDEHRTPVDVLMQPGHRGLDLRAAAHDHIESVFARAFNDPPAGGWYNHLLAEVEAPLLDLTMRFAHGNQIRGAALLGINRNTLRKKLALHEIRVTRRRRVM